MLLSMTALWMCSRPGEGRSESVTSGRIYVKISIGVSLLKLPEITKEMSFLPWKSRGRRVSVNFTFLRTFVRSRREF